MAALDREEDIATMLGIKPEKGEIPTHTLFSVVKIRPTEKASVRQTRVLLFTNKALYNLKQEPLSRKKAQRVNRAKRWRIDLDLITAIKFAPSSCETPKSCAKQGGHQSDQFIIHVPEEYDMLV